MKELGHILIQETEVIKTFYFTENSDKHLADFGIQNGSRLKCDDFLQVYDLIINIVHRYIYINRFTLVLRTLLGFKCKRAFGPLTFKSSHPHFCLSHLVS